MSQLWLLLHVLGFALWMGGGFASMVAGIRGRGEDRAIQAAVSRLQAAIGRTLVGPGAVATLVSGVFLSVRLVNSAAAPSIWLMVMQGVGVLAAALTLFVTLPTTARLARIDAAGATSALFDALRKRQAMVGLASGALGVVALVAGVLARF